MNSSNVKIVSGSVLLSEPFMDDPNFKRAVVLLCEHKDEGSVGFIINKTLNMRLPEAVPELDGFDVPLYFGGPVETDTLHYLHRVPDLEGSVHLFNGLYWGGNFEILSILIQTRQVEPTDIRFYLGYAGWSPGQLVDEVEEKSWISHNAQEAYIFCSEQETLWRNILVEKGGDYKLMANFPEDPRFN